MYQTIQFCCGGKKCPVVTEVSESHIQIGGKEEGITTWERGQFTDFVNAAKSGKFDELLTEK
jgi:hypothetical protein